MFEDLFDLSAADMNDEDIDWMNDTMTECNIHVIDPTVMMDILFEDEAILSTAMRTGDLIYTYLAVMRFMQFKMVHASRDDWFKFAEKCKERALQFAK